ncbi:hypothetical protein LTR10_016972 [Elasticomyces elasticus]|uniref:Enoyl reductase (ER) domain-containing protein n=1 Tax=Exophiala sideris TaxID=1016849 RepID=A0ABR0JEY5_9EURO|nr:hypothetical protein LTR10_016972 [Elasticomyces elasticus]KAK5025226.1 hypothetical protein LTS07_008077 [Exophiala sideris]KAK5029226.1 hypothetical protein LTR13_008763 [Exophiala sideris]KAK5063285.1 hypothetical protein LTR69_003991 [Exophiala sideris]KAK5179001.1 hypothetical protein LTR44_008490 [Eurotiomycetes sp. CCFEE 6388]
MPGNPPWTMRVWQYSSTKGGLEKNLHLNTSAPIPQPGPEQYLVQVLATALNPIDYKPAETALVNRLLIRKPATPGLDFAGYLVKAPAGSTLKRGQLVYGVTGTSPMAGGALSEFAITQKNQIIALPDHLDTTSAATLGVASLTAFQTIVPHVKKGDKVFINGGSGGTGIFGIQIAKAIGCYVATTCSGANADLCKSLGADEVIDYRKQNVVDALKATGHNYDHVVDNVGHNMELYWRCHEYTKPSAIYIFVAGELSLPRIWETIKRKLWPGFLGGGKRQARGFFAQARPRELEQVVAWMKEGKLRTVVDQRFPFEQAPKAIERLKTQRARGKIVVEVTSEALKSAWLKE